MTEIWQTAAEEFVSVARRAWERGLVAGSGGNISIRLPNSSHILVKPSGVASIDCSPDTLLRVDLDGTVAEGQGRPTKDLNFHLGIYRMRPDVHGIVHAHVPWATSLTLLGYQELPLLTPHAQARLQHVPVLPYAASQSQELEDLVTAAFACPETVAVLLERHGLVAVGPTLTAAENIAELTEESAEIAWLVHVGRRSGGA